MTEPILPQPDQDPTARSSPWGIDQLAGEIADIYRASGREEAWEHEEHAVVACIEKLGARLERYESPTAIGVGGLGIVLRVSDRHLSGQRCAVKFPRPRPGSQALFAEMISKEITNLSQIRHAGVVRIHGAGQVESERALAPVPYYVMDFVEGQASSSHTANISTDELVDVIRLTADAIAALHDVDLVHCDLKPDNVMIDGRGRPVITDLGTTKAFRPDDDIETRIGVTRSFAPREVIDYIEVQSETDPDNFSGLIPRSRIRKQWDLVCFGKTILTWLGFNIKSGEASQSTYAVNPYARKYLLLMAARLLGQKDGSQWLANMVNLPGGVIEQFRYERIGEVVEDLDKLSGRYELARKVPELDPYYPDRIQVGLATFATLTPRVKSLVNHSALRRLGAITQLGIINQVYPTGSHSRFEHSLGTYAQACRLLRSLYNDPFSPFFRQVMSAQDLSAILALSLLHDSGQFPLAHDLEEIDSDLFDHKRLTRAVLKGERNPKSAGYQRLELPPIGQELAEWGLDAQALVTLLDVRLDRPAAGVKERILHSIIDGAVDADKLDYLPRDSNRLGVPYGAAIDHDRIANGVTSIVTTNAGGSLVACIGVHEKARESAELLTISRSAMFSRAYWQHTVRAMKAMLTRAVERIAVHLGASGEAQNKFISDFEHFVMALPGSLSPRAPQLEFDEGGAASVVRQPLVLENPGTIAATDGAVLIFLEEYMAGLGLKDQDLLRAIRARALYKRLHVWSLSGEDRVGAQLAETWRRLDAKGRIAVYELIEEEVGSLVVEAKEQQPPTVALEAAAIDRVRFRIETGLPTLLIDVPGARPGAEIPLYYVQETERRALRKDGSAVGPAHPSTTWEEYGRGLQQKAGKLRVFCHPDVIEPFEAALSREKFIGLFEQACSDASVIR